MKHDRFPYGRAFLFYYGLAYVKSILRLFSYGGFYKLKF